VIALVGDAHQPFSQAECEDDLGRAGQKRADAQRLGHCRLGLFLYQAIERFEVGQEPEEETRHFGSS